MKSKRGWFKIIVQPCLPAGRLLYCLIVIMAAFFLFAKITKAADDHLVINEVYPCPITGESEWIELYNPTDIDVDLLNYSIEDGTYHINNLSSHTITSNSYHILNKSIDFTFGLNNDGDTVILRNNGLIIDQVTYGSFDDGNKTDNAEAPTQGKSVTRIVGKPDTDVDSNDFSVADSTSGEEFVFVETEPIDETINIEEARSLENGEDVTIEGTVTALPGVLSTQYFYIQDGTGGIQVYCSKKTFPILLVGDLISVSGELSETSNERRIKISSADQIIIQSHTEPPPPLEVATSEIGEESEGEYIKTAGIVTETSGDTFYISDGIKEIKVVIRSTTGIEKPKMKKGDQVEVMGIVSQYKDEYRILPIDQDDVKIVASESILPKAGNEAYVYLFISLFSTILWNIYLGAKKKLTT